MVNCEERATVASRLKLLQMERRIARSEMYRARALGSSVLIYHRFALFAKALKPRQLGETIANNVLMKRPSTPRTSQRHCTESVFIVTSFRFRANSRAPTRSLDDQAAGPTGRPSNKDQRKCARARRSFIRLINCRELPASTIRMNLLPISSNILN